MHRTPELRDFVLEQDVIYVGGGNTRSMLAVWREWGLPELLREAWQAGSVLAGISAGALCWFEQGVTDSGADALYAIDGLGFLPGSCCPHYDGEADRRPGYRALLESGKIAPGLAIDDEAARLGAAAREASLAVFPPPTQVYVVQYPHLLGGE